MLGCHSSTRAHVDPPRLPSRLHLIVRLLRRVAPTSDSHRPDRDQELKCRSSSVHTVNAHRSSIDCVYESNRPSVMDQSTITLRVTSGARDLARVTVRRQQFAVGRPIEFDEAAPRIAALEYALGAVGAEAVNGFRVFADRRRLSVRRHRSRRDGRAPTRARLPRRDWRVRSAGGSPYSRESVCLMPGPGGRAGALRRDVGQAAPHGNVAGRDAGID